MADIDEVHELAARMKELSAEINTLKSRTSELQKEYDDIRKRKLPELLANERVEGMKLEGIGTLSMRADLYVHCPASQRAALVEWCDENDVGDLAARTVNPQTLKAFVKERMMDGKELPEMLSVTPYEVAVITKGNK